MKKEISQEIEIPEGIKARLEGTKLIVEGLEGENSREFGLGKINFKIENNKIILSYSKATKKEKKIINTTAAHIKNMLQGIQKKIEYKAKICSSHFPMKVIIEKEKVIIKNFLGEKIPREVKIPLGAELEIEKDIITIKSVDKEIAGQATANLEKATQIKKRDKRVFQDGIYIINKAGKEI
jgi:large subunit ribosomal protein L6